MNTTSAVYKRLLQEYGPQGWWPLCTHSGTNPTKSGAIRGYHPGDYSFPRTDTERFEICVGAILTQNTAWTSVEKALTALHSLNAMSPKKLLALNDETLKGAIRPAGYFNQKALSLRAFTQFFISLQGRTPTREELLKQRGIGPETADSMLLYAWHKPSFVIDAYTKRIFSRIGLCDADADYHDLQTQITEELPRDEKTFNEYHALLVELAKRHCTKTDPDCKSCPLRKNCRFGASR